MRMARKKQGRCRYNRDRIWYPYVGQIALEILIFLPIQRLSSRGKKQTLNSLIELIRNRVTKPKACKNGTHPQNAICNLIAHK